MLDEPISESMRDDAIAREIEVLRSKIARAERDRAELDRTIANAREEERLLLRLLALRKGAMATGESPSSERAAPEREPSGERANAANAKDDALQAVLHELASVGRPLHISELMRLVRMAGVRIPGAGTQANLITYLRRDRRIVRPSRGMYGLAAWGLEDLKATPVRRRKKRMRSRATAGRTDK